MPDSSMMIPCRIRVVSIQAEEPRRQIRVEAEIHPLDEITQRPLKLHFQFSEFGRPKQLAGVWDAMMSLVHEEITQQLAREVTKEKERLF